MDDDDDDLYGSSAPAQAPQPNQQAPSTRQPVKNEDDGGTAMDEDDSDDDSDSDIDIIVERKPEQKQESSAPPTRPESARVKIEAPPERTGSTQPHTDSPAPPKGTITGPPSGKNYPEVHTSDIDVNATPTYEPMGKPITDVLIEADAAWDEKPWRHPGSDPKDYFNYGFDEFTWQTYCERQKSLREFKGQVDAESNAVMAFLGGPGQMAGMMPGAGGPPNAPTGPAAGGDMAGMQNMMGDPMMAQMMQQMMQQSGGDPNNMDESMFFNAMQQMSGQGMGMDVMQQQQQQQQHGGGHRGGYGSGRRGRRGW